MQGVGIAAGPAITDTFVVDADYSQAVFVSIGFLTVSLALFTVVHWQER